MITVYTGLPGSGKSLKLASEIIRLLDRNIAYFKKSGIKRYLWSNIKLSPDLEDKYGDFIEYWSDPSQLVKQMHCDVIWDEIATHLDSSRWQDTPLELKRWLQQHRKRGIDIFGTTQDFPMIDIAMKRLVGSMYVMYKLVGSRDKSATRPPVKKVWGLILMREVAPSSFRKSDRDEYKFIGFDWFMITKKLCSAYDTGQEIFMGEYPPLKHITRRCEDPECGFVKTLHV